MEPTKAEVISSIAVLFLSLLILYSEANPTSFNLPFHEQVNSSLLKQMFNLESDDKVPEYEVVQLRVLTKRSADDEKLTHVHLSAFGKDITLHLQRNDDFNQKKVKVFMADVTGKGLQLTEVFSEDEPGIPYQDSLQMAAISIWYDTDGKLQMEGTIGEDLVIKPVPTDVEFFIDPFSRDGNPADEDETYRSYNVSERFKNFGYSAHAGSSSHIIYRSLMRLKPSLKHFMSLNDVDHDVNSAGFEGFRYTKGIQAWPEILLVVDSESYNWHLSHGLNEEQIRRYYISFLNGVDLRFKILSNPKVSLVLSNIIISKSMDATPYIKYNLVSEAPKVFDASNAIVHLSRYFYLMKKEKILREFDVVILLTKLDMCTDLGLYCSRETTGLAYFQGACTVKEERWMGVGIVEDNGGFDGILTAAHELGHLLGADHDNYPDISFRGVRLCSLLDGFIMSNMITSDRIFQWSVCSRSQIRYFLKSEKADCLFNQPDYYNELEGSELPGSVLSLDEQCKRVWGTSACAHDNRVCTSLHCYRRLDEDLTWLKFNSCSPGLAPAAEGSSCGKELHCRHGKCVSTSMIYTPAWNMKQIHEEDSFMKPLVVRTTKKPPTATDCVYSESFCENYFCTIDRDEACKNSRIIEECSDVYKIFCLKTYIE